MSDVRHLVFAILKFLQEQRENSGVSEDAQESLEVAEQCLESAFGVSLSEEGASEKYPLPESLQTIFFSQVQTRSVSETTSAVPDVSPANKEEAEKEKQKGNDLMKQDKYHEAVECYSKAIACDGSNAVYYCNRAAAYSKLNQHEDAVHDCDKAIQIDPNYSKAYGRKGIACGLMNNHREAKECYEKALKLDPDNQSYKNNLAVSEQKLREASPGGDPLGGMPGGMGGFNLGRMDFSSFLNNPALMNMATQMMSNPQTQSMMANMMQAAGGNQGGEMGIQNLLQAGQQLAQQMQQNNPELVEQLRQQARQDGDPSGRKEEEG